MSPAPPCILWTPVLAVARSPPTPSFSCHLGPSSSKLLTRVSPSTPQFRDIREGLQDYFPGPHEEFRGFPEGKRSWCSAVGGRGRRSWLGGVISLTRSRGADVGAGVAAPSAVRHGFPAGSGVRARSGQIRACFGVFLKHTHKIFKTGLDTLRRK